MTAKFSLLTACCNNAVHLPACIESVMNQREKDWQWIIVDDHSDDNSYEILQKVKDPRVKVVRNSERLFCSSTYATALKYATAPVCGILDADDALVPEAMAAVLGRYEAYPKIDYIYTQHYWCDDRLTPKRTGLSACPKGRSFVEVSMRWKRHCFSHFRTFRTEMRKKGVIFPDGLKYAVDKNMGFILEELGRGAFFPKKLYYYRYHVKNMSRTNASDQKSTWMSLAKARLKHRKSNKVVPYPVREIR
jgi:glycosyltransferase involved in cell wall biosynthesis